MSDKPKRPRGWPGAVSKLKDQVADHEEELESSAKELDDQKELLRSLDTRVSSLDTSMHSVWIALHGLESRAALLVQDLSVVRDQIAALALGK